ncbi:pseudaminic acid cytidylyltransferase [Novosphingopyxis sp. YJ-S2-01]|uniref:pseudaminic acid cytidylyltransferase n=1 Tax=Novosphingopyxis sp. YJ-S2-01 TaxID=2794021 RepID=UPI0018DEB211|nr:pseudaminic acid cytidylyltransferase [Novosphingopyxis sp. YJ-S2-01]MBH9538440.1 pseudaminic acid cytidylyltransferase [Novosphingopyxis sp. YJ-S2-01]
MIAIIPARGGSKRIPRKNLKDFCGRPIIAYSIEAALSSGLFEHVMVSTDDAEIAEVAREHGADVPFLRSAKAADDYASTADVLVEVIAEYRARGVTPDIAACIYPTAPFVTPEKLTVAAERLSMSEADCVMPIARFSFPIWRSFRRESDQVFYNWPEHAPKRSQDLPPAFHDAGQFYVFRVPVLERTGQFITDKTIGIEMPDLEVQDIDTNEDWAMAELKFGILQQSAGPNLDN